MMLSPPLKWTLVASLAAAGFAALQPGGDGGALVEPLPPSAARSRLDEAAPSSRVGKAEAVPADADELVADLSARNAWPSVAPAALLAWGAPPPPPPPEPPPPEEPPAPPQAPPFPYTLIGRIDDEFGPQLLLTGPMKTIAARPRDVIDGQWRIDAVQAGGATLTWLPGSLPQTLSYRPS